MTDTLSKVGASPGFDIPKRPTTAEMIAELKGRYPAMFSDSVAGFSLPTDWEVGKWQDAHLAAALAQDAEAMAQAFAAQEALLANPPPAFLLHLVKALMRGDEYCKKIQGFHYGNDFVVRDQNRKPMEQTVYRAPYDPVSNERSLDSIRASIRVTSVLEAIINPPQFLSEPPASKIIRES